MKTIYILIVEDTILSSAAGPVDIFTRTNDILAQSGQGPAFRVELVSGGAKHIQPGAPAQFICQRTIDELPARSAGHHAPLIMVPAFAHDWESVREKNRAVIDWLRKHYAAGTEIASLCKGSYFLAEAGILDGKPGTSHWACVADMQQRFPAVRMQGDAVITDRDGTYTGGGAFSSLNLVLYLVEKFCGHEIGIKVSKNFSIHRDHISQAHFSVFRGLNQHSDTVVLAAQDFIEQRFRDGISIDQVAGHVNMSKRNFIRRFKQATQYTPLEYLQQVRIEAVKKQLENSNLSVQALMYDVGYSDSKTFRGVFKRITGVTPQVYRKKYGRAG